MTSKMLGALLMILLQANGSFASDAISQHGGRVVEEGDYHVELVAKADTVDVYLADHDNKAIRSAGLQGAGDPHRRRQKPADRFGTCRRVPAVRQGRRRAAKRAKRGGADHVTQWQDHSSAL